MQVPGSRFGSIRLGFVLAILTADASLAQAAFAQPAEAPPATNTASPASTAAQPGSAENLTVLGHSHKFQPAPMPGPELGPPPDKPSIHLGRYKISGDQSKKDGYDTQTGAYIAPFGNAYTQAGPVADGLASRFQH